MSGWRVGWNAWLCGLAGRLAGCPVAWMASKTNDHASFSWHCGARLAFLFSHTMSDTSSCKASHLKRSCPPPSGGWTATNSTIPKRKGDALVRSHFVWVKTVRWVCLARRLRTSGTPLALACADTSLMAASRDFAIFVALLRTRPLVLWIRLHQVRHAASVHGLIEETNRCTTKVSFICTVVGLYKAALCDNRFFRQKAFSFRMSNARYMLCPITRRFSSKCKASFDVVPVGNSTRSVKSVENGNVGPLRLRQRNVCEE